MKTSHRFLAPAAALLFVTSGLLAQTPTTTPPTTGSDNRATPPTSTPPTTTPPVPPSRGPDNGNPVGTTPGSTTMPPTTTTMTPPSNPSATRPNENASDTAKAVLSVIQAFDAKRDAAMAERRALIDKLQAAKTDAERQAIIAQLRSETQAEKDQQTQLGKQIRDELKKLRDQRKSGGS